METTHGIMMVVLFAPCFTQRCGLQARSSSSRGLTIAGAAATDVAKRVAASVENITRVEKYIVSMI